MHEYLEIFKKISRSTEDLISDQYHSVNSEEIKQSAIELQSSIEGCIGDVQSFLVALMQSMDEGFYVLKDAEINWHSKARTSSIPRHKIWSQVDIVTNIFFTINSLAAQSKSNLIDKGKAAWVEEFNKLKAKYNLDNKSGGQKILRSDKINFSNEVYDLLVNYSHDLEMNLVASFNPLCSEIRDRKLKDVEELFNELDEDIRKIIGNEFSELIEKIRKSRNKIENPYDIRLSEECGAIVQAWKIGISDVCWSNILQFEQKVLNVIEERTKLVFDKKYDLLKGGLEKIMEFYNEILERQNRYQKETIVQRQAEKVWIDQQYEDLNSIKLKIDALKKIFPELEDGLDSDDLDEEDYRSKKEVREEVELLRERVENFSIDGSNL